MTVPLMRKYTHCLQEAMLLPGGLRRAPLSSVLQGPPIALSGRQILLPR